MDGNDMMTQKIRVSLEAGGSEGLYTITTAPVLLEFIYGIAPGGLTSFESALGQMAPGEGREISLAGSEAAEYFGNLYRELQQSLGIFMPPPRLFLRFTLDSCEEAEPAAIVKAMARSIGDGGCGGGCGCGCG